MSLVGYHGMTGIDGMTRVRLTFPQLAAARRYQALRVTDRR